MFCLIHTQIINHTQRLNRLSQISFNPTSSQELWWNKEEGILKHEYRTRVSQKNVAMYVYFRLGYNM